MMIDSIWDFYYTNFIKQSFLIVCFLGLCRVLFKNKIDIVIALSILKWLILLHALVSTIQGIVLFVEIYDPVSYEQFSVFRNRAFGEYWWAYWIMMISNTLLPFLLLFKKLGKKLIVVFLISFLINIGWLMELIIILTSSIHRGIAPWNMYDSINPMVVILLFLVNSLLIASVLLLVGNIIKNRISKFQMI